MATSFRLDDLGEQPALDPPKVEEVHVSDVSAYLACRRQWAWASRLRSNLEPRRPYHAFFTGRALHHCCERMHMHGEAWEDSLPPFLEEEIAVIKGSGSIWDEEQEMINEQVELITAMLDHYVKWEARQRGPFSLENLEFLTVEQEFAVPIICPKCSERMEGAVFAGKWDGIVRRRDNGHIYIWEIKSARSIPQRVKMLANDNQATFYTNAAKDIFGEDVKGVLYTIMAKRIPPKVKVLNSGMLSTDTRNQSFESYLAAIRAHHGEAATKQFISYHYGAPLLALNDSPNSANTYFERHVVTRTEHALLTGQQHLWDIATGMLDMATPTYPTPSFHCNYCMFYEPCIVMQNGGNYGIILAEQYRERVEHAGESDVDDVL